MIFKINYIHWLLLVKIEPFSVPRHIWRMSRSLLLLWAVALVAKAVRLCGDCPVNSTASICEQPTDERQEIVLLGLFPCNTDIFIARGITVASQMAAYQISYKSNILPGYRLKLLADNSMVRCVDK